MALPATLIHRDSIDSSKSLNCLETINVEENPSFESLEVGLFSLKRNAAFEYSGASKLCSDEQKENDFFVKLKKCDEKLKDLWNTQSSQEKLLINTLDKLWKNEIRLKKQNDELKEQVQLIEKENAEMLNQIKSAEEKLSECAKELKTGKLTQIELAQKSVIESKRDKSVVDLLENITQTRWANEQSKDTLQGVMVSDSIIKPFSYNLKEISEENIKKHLWEQLTEGDKFSTELQNS